MSPRILRLSLKTMQDYAKHRGGECLSDTYSNSSTKLKWKCRLGHTWESTPANIYHHKHWCPTCAKTLKMPRIKSLPPFDAPYYRKKAWLVLMKSIAKERGGECLSEEYRGQKVKLKFVCSEGHEFESTPDNINLKGSWCKVCSGKSKHTIEDMQKIAKQRQGECLSKEYVNSQTNLRWRCQFGCEWEATPNNIIHMNSWCPECNTPEGLYEYRMKEAKRKQKILEATKNS